MGLLEIKCVECGKFIDAEEYSYGHDCEDMEDDMDSDMDNDMEIANPLNAILNEIFGTRLR